MNRAFFISTILLMLLGQTLRAQSSGQFYYVADDTDRLYLEDRTTGNTTFIGTTASDIQAIAFLPDPSTPVLYAANGGQFGSINTSTGAFTAIGSNGIDNATTLNGSASTQSIDDVDGMSLDPRTMKMWAVERNSGAPDLLFQIDVTTGIYVLNAFGTGIDYLEITGTLS